MMDYIRKRPTCWPPGVQQGGVHESVMRSFHILGKVCELLQKKTPHDVILEIIDDLKGAPEPTAAEATEPDRPWGGGGGCRPD